MNVNRRQFFTHLGRGLASSLCDTIDAVRGATRSDVPQKEVAPLRPWIRPPGARLEDEFRSTCTQCTDCQKACPYQSIRRLGPEWGDDAGTPAIIPAESPCYLCADMPCITACEPKALLKMFAWAPFYCSKKPATFPKVSRATIVLRAVRLG